MSIGVETLVLVVIVALVLRVAYPAIERNSALMADFKPCRGRWWEAEIRGCATWNKRLPVEPVNSYSNLAYLAAGWVTFRLIGSWPAAVFGAAMAYLCVGSALYHGVKTMWAVKLDHSAMYGVFATLAFYAMAPEHPQIVWPVLIGGVASAWLLRFEFPGNINVRMGLLLSLMLVGALLRGHTWLGVWSIGLFAVAFAIWNMDKKKILWGRFGHGIWHVLTAAAIAVMFLALTP